MELWLLGVLIWALLSIVFCLAWWRWMGYQRSADESDRIKHREEPKQREDPHTRD
jgi:membrane protein implicated in regulation of membrane protease activity